MGNRSKQVTDLPVQHDEPAHQNLMAFLRSGTSKDFRQFLLFSGFMHVAVLISGPFFVMYLLQDLHLPYWEYGTWMAAAIVGQFITLPGWGRFSDRFGNKAPLTFTGFLVSFLPMLYLVSSTWLFLVTLNFFGGVVWAGLSLGLSNYVFDAVRPADRAQGVAVSSTVNAIGWAIGTLTGSWLISTVPGNVEFGALSLHPASNLPFIFFISGVLRLSISSALLCTFREPVPAPLQRPGLMLSFHAHLKVFVATKPSDLRANFNGLWTAAQERLGEDPKSGALFVFGNRRRNRVKLLYFDGTGVCVLAKRLERGTFHWPQRAGEPNAKVRLAPQALQLLLDGVDLRDGARRAWYEAAG